MKINSPVESWGALQEIYVPSYSENDEHLIKNLTTFLISASPTSASPINQLKESMALQELDFTEFIELTQAKLTAQPDNYLQQLNRKIRP